MFYWVKTNRFIKWLFSNQVWSIPNSKNNIYLTFDDGPTPEITEWVLDLLKQNEIKATFFCIGKNIEQNPELFKNLLQEGHVIGNHTFNHVNGWKTSTENYLKNAAECEGEISKLNTEKSLLFRPPYGKIKPSQSKKIRDLGFKIIMWDILTADFDASISPEKCFENATKKVESGSIIVFHDSKKAFENMKHALPKAIEYYKRKGFTFETL
ncbi:polysaccharide deacetylase family protein [Flavobacterium amnicola]|uniref:Polysaccharide deacetylase family protein n=1 Tax=Flavobacterium amnicola TaxID=2506422 RepID=A0A4V1N260_9FLAO|nr:polysaccharide deacetylase family protein [Flavobacterium amnicola]RXR20591.1 polysaccharide deacetylase family protein [Flavobacterium amnicola]